MTSFANTIPAMMIAAGLAACAPVPEAGIADPDAVHASASDPVVTSTRPAAKVAACFEARARLLPLSSFTDDLQTGGKIYRLRGVGDRPMRLAG